MKTRFIKLIAVILFLITSTSWGYRGHQTIGYIAQRHLTPVATQAVKQLLGNHSLADIASWADEVARQPQWKYTGTWHYVNVAPGLNKQQFESAVKASPDANLLKGLTKCELEINNPETSIAQKVIDLKFIVHLTGDAHQPMHVSRAQDKGGNKIQVRFDGRGTNLHALWDSKLLEKQNLTDAQFAARFDRPSAQQITQWQSAAPLDWMYESYQLSTRLYAETAASRNLTGTYYNQHIALADQRLEIAAIRLAGLLNRMFKNGLQLTNAAKLQANKPWGDQVYKPVDVHDAANHYNEKVTVITKIFGVKSVGGLTLADAGGRYPNQLLTIVLKGKAEALANRVKNRTVQVSGTVVQYKGKPEIVVTDPAKLTIK